HFQQIEKKLQRVNLPEERIRGFIDNLFQGLNSQMYNTPIDLFIEQRIYNRFSDLRPYQFMSLLKLTEEYIKSSTDGQVKQLVTNKIHSTNKILSLVNTLQLEALYNINLTKRFRPKYKDLEQSKELYQDWKSYKNNHKPGLEYDLIDKW